jgi:hypothetical protein
LNDVYKDREEILTSLSDFKDKGTFDWQIATDKQVTNARALADALGARFGKEVDFDFIAKNLDKIEAYLNGDKKAAQELNIALNQIPQIDASFLSSVDAAFENWHVSAKSGEGIESGLQGEIDNLIKDLNLTE